MSRFKFPQRRPPRRSREPFPYKWSDTPDVLGHIEGARVWRISDDGTRLWSMVRPVVWLPGELVTARCYPNGPGGRPASPDRLIPDPCKECPQPDCACGIWGAYNYRKLGHFSKNWKPGRVFPSADGLTIGGAIAAHGRVVEGQVGFRAQYAKPIALSYEGFIKEERWKVEQLSEIYALPILDKMPTFKKPE